MGWWVLGKKEMDDEVKEEDKEGTIEMKRQSRSDGNEMRMILVL
jgi:hypothetical protein